ncbi:hypothetical protein NG819_14610 [Pseudarthrobacter sp. Fe7]|nr:hypothetical protein NG819_14610 [Pseudarthrobacter sp. Fe7]
MPFRWIGIQRPARPADLVRQRNRAEGLLRDLPADPDSRGEHREAVTGFKLELTVAKRNAERLLNFVGDLLTSALGALTIEPPHADLTEAVRHSVQGPPAASLWTAPPPDRYGLLPS